MTALHRRAPLVLSALLVFVGVSLNMSAAAQSQLNLANLPEPVTQKEFYTVLASGFLLTILGVAGAVKYVMSTVLVDLRAAVADLRASVAAFNHRQYNHDGDPVAHPSAFAPRDQRLAKLEHDFVNAVEECIGHRAKRRSTDPQTGGPNDSGPDFTDESTRAQAKAERLRGRQ